jgi:hypothetical protein
VSLSAEHLAVLPADRVEQFHVHGQEVTRWTPYYGGGTARGDMYNGPPDPWVDQVALERYGMYPPFGPDRSAGSGVENARKALEVFLKAGAAQRSTGLIAGAGGKTYIDILESDTRPDLMGALTYGPFFETFEVIPVVPIDETWPQAIQTAQAHWH